MLTFKDHSEKKKQLDQSEKKKQLDQSEKKKRREYMREYFAKNPDKAEANRIAAQRRYYRRKGYTAEQIEEILQYLMTKPKF